MAVQQRRGHVGEQPRLRSEQARRSDLRLKFSGCCSRERERVWIPLEQCWGDLIDSFIGALCRQNGGDQQLVRVAEA